MVKITGGCGLVGDINTQHNKTLLDHPPCSTTLQSPSIPVEPRFLENGKLAWAHGGMEGHLSLQMEGRGSGKRAPVAG